MLLAGFNSNDTMIRAKAHFRLDRSHILKEKHLEMNVGLQLLCEDPDDRGRTFGSVIKMFTGQRTRRLTNEERQGELHVEFQCERKFLGRRERSWSARESSDQHDGEPDLQVPPNYYPPFVML